MVAPVALRRRNSGRVPAAWLGALCLVSIGLGLLGGELLDRDGDGTNAEESRSASRGSTAPESQSPESSASHQHVVEDPGRALVAEGGRSGLPAGAPDPREDKRGYFYWLLGDERAAEWEERILVEADTDDIADVLPWWPCPEWEEVADEFRREFCQEDGPLPAGTVLQDQVLRRNSYCDRKYELQDPDFQSSRKLNPDGVPLDWDDLLALDRLDREARREMQRFLAEDWWAARQAAAGRAFDRGDFTKSELHLGLPGSVPPPFPGAKRRYQRHVSGSAWWAAEMSIWEGEDSVLDEVCEELEFIWSQRLFAIHNYIDGVAKPKAELAGWQPSNG